MPKKRMTSADWAQGAEEYPELLAGWQATGPSLAVAAGGAAFGGLGTLAGAIVFAPVVHALVRLRAATPGASNVADLVATTLGRRTGSFAAILQAVGFVLLAAVAAGVVGFEVSVQLVDDPLVLLDSWLWPLVSIAALVLLALFSAAAPDVVVTGVVTVLASAGLLIYFYLALAVTARVVTGATFDGVAPDDQGNGLMIVGTLGILAAGMAGFDVVTTRSSTVRSVGRPMLIAIGATTAFALLVWLADHLGSPGELRLRPTRFSLLVEQLFPEVGVPAMFAGTTCLSVALLLALLWGIARLIRVVTAEPVVVPIVTVAPIAVLVIARSRNWLGGSQLTVFVGATALLVVYAVVVEASARLGDSTVIWWSRILTPSALAAIVLLPMLGSRFSADTVAPVAVAAALVAVAALTAATVGRSRPPD